MSTLQQSGGVGEGGEGSPQKPSQRGSCGGNHCCHMCPSPWLQREILRIYLRTNKIMMVFLTLIAPNPKLLLFPFLPPLSSLSFLHDLITHCSHPISTRIPPSLPLPRSVSYCFSSFLSSHVSSSCPLPPLSMALSLSLFSRITGSQTRDGSCPPGPWSGPIQTSPAHPDLLGLISHPL